MKMTSTQPIVFVTSATGTVGSALAIQLLALGWGVNFTTRDPSSPAAQSLVALGASLFHGSWDDLPALTTALTPCTHLFINTFPDFTAPSIEVNRVCNLLSLAKSKPAPIQHVIYSGSLPTQDLPSFDPSHPSAPFRLAKTEIESLVQSSGIRFWTILRPGYFMANFFSGKIEMHFPNVTQTGVFLHGNTPEEVLPLTDEADIAKFALAAFQHPQKFHGQVIAIASEPVTTKEAITTKALPAAG